MQFFILFITVMTGIVYPNVVAPLFNQFHELPPSELRTNIYNLASAI